MYKKTKQIKPTTLYIILTITFLLSAILILILSNGSLFRLFFFSDQDDSLMDFFNSLIEVHTKKPYSEFGILYPPLANCYFFFLQLFIPTNIKEIWPKNHKDTLYLVGTSKDIRLNQNCMIVFLLSFLLFIFLFAILVKKILKEQSNILIFCLIFSHAMLQIIDRGNVIIISFVFTLIFYLNHENSNKLIKELSLISLAISFGFKLYPAFFGIILFKKKQYKEAFRTILYGIILTFIPMMLLDGFSGFSLWINNVFHFSSDPYSRTENYFRIVFILICVIVLLVDVFFTNYERIISLKESQFIMIICWLMIIICGDTESYSLIFVILPFLLFCNEEVCLNRYNITEYIVYLCCILPMGINKLEYVFFPIFVLCSYLRNFKSKSTK